MQFVCNYIIIVSVLTIKVNNIELKTQIISIYFFLILIFKLKGGILINLKNVSFTFNTTSKKPTYMLDDISLHVPKGEYISVIGDNGSR